MVSQDRLEASPAELQVEHRSYGLGVGQPLLTMMRTHRGQGLDGNVRGRSQPKLRRRMQGRVVPSNSKLTFNCQNKIASVLQRSSSPKCGSSREPVESLK